MNLQFNLIGKIWQKFLPRKVKKLHPKPVEKGGGRGSEIHFCSMDPNDLSFFPAKLEINPDLMVEISTGNIPELSTRKCLKSANMR